MRERILAGHRRGRRARNRGDRRRLRPPAPARRRRPARRPCLRAGGIGVPPVRWPSRSGRSGAGEKPVPDGSRCSRMCWWALSQSAACGHMADAIATSSPSAAPGSSAGCTWPDLATSTCSSPPRRSTGRAGEQGGHRKAGAERCGSLTAGLRGDVTLEIALEPSGRARRSARHVARLLQWQLRRTSRSRLMPEREAQVADRRWMRWSVDGAAIR